MQNKKGILLVALGTPRSYKTEDVKEYLKEFLSDPLVIQKPRWFWLPILNGIILKVRPAKSAEMYKQIWSENGSPLMNHTSAQTKQLQEIYPEADVRFAMTYGEPRIDKTIKDMQNLGIEDITILPLYPQYSLTTVEPIVQQVKKINPHLKVIKDFHKIEGYTDLLVNLIKKKWNSGEYDKLILSYHGIPQSYVTKKKDPYEKQCQKTTELVINKLGLKQHQFEHTYQSKFGPEKWLEPATIDRVARLPKEGAKKVLICSPAFVADCLETLFELEIENKEVFISNGGETFDFVHPFNSSIEFTKVIKTILAATD
ncbi:ferrochelatase [Lactococcus allomyrinae]|uniref:Coproporphyrin III ferrochelatase n=1 Tax=Lactococcus allomyrinae TaxID=2419773 RepID=A0A387BDI8_9LACT|nr:ferrochelatase [Lactococcus allomyrinae]AYG00122.1 ferrochelatase [Lactococcus allomyrinae]